MSIELKIPALGESISEVEIGEWLKTEGSPVNKDENLAVIETEKATVELPSPASGTLGKILKGKGETAKVGEVVGYVEAGETAPDSPPPPPPPAPAPAAEAKAAPEAPQPSKAVETPPASNAEPAPASQSPASPQAKVMPAAERVLAEKGLTPAQVTATGPGGRLLKEDVEKEPAKPAAISPPPAAAEPAKTSEAKPPPPPPSGPAPAQPSAAPDRQEEIVRMSRFRRTVAERLVQAQHQAALLTTFNEIDMSEVMQLRKDYGEGFRERHGVKLGFMSFFVKAVVGALREAPLLNAEIRGENIVYHHYFDIGVAIGGGKGLVVPVIRNAEKLGFAEVEKTIATFAARARDGKLTLEELAGGTFTITNGGVYGSLMSTPLVNPPQSGVLGMHSIQERPIARQGAVVIRPMMYVALTYDHRIVDGREAVTFLKRIKEFIETPSRLLLEA